MLRQIFPFDLIRLYLNNQEATCTQIMGIYVVADMSREFQCNHNQRMQVGETGAG